MAQRKASGVQDARGREQSLCHRLLLGGQGDDASFCEHKSSEALSPECDDAGFCKHKTHFLPLASEQKL
jgi:hypothetical protein